MTNTNNNSSFKIEKSTTEITTIDQLAQSLANHTRLISDKIIMPTLKQPKDYKPIIEFFHSVKKHLIHDLSHEEFADLYAQTLTFGLFTAVILSKGRRKFTRFDILKTISKTNFVLHELFEYISRKNIPIQLEFIIIRIISDLQQMKSKKLLNEYLKVSHNSTNVELLKGGKGGGFPEKSPPGSTLNLNQDPLIHLGHKN